MVQFHGTIHFPSSSLLVKPPVPVKPTDGLPLTTDYGVARFFFSDWDMQWNDPARGDESLDEMSFVLDLTPRSGDLFHFEGAHDAWAAVSFWQASPENLQAHQRATDARYRGSAYDDWDRTRAELSEKARRAASEWLEGPLSEQLKAFGDSINRSIRTLLEVLRVSHLQVTIPDPPRWIWRSVHLEFTSEHSIRVSDELIQSWLELPKFRLYDRALDLAEWPEIASKVEGNWKPALADVLLANARGECDPFGGNPRMAVIEAVTALEIGVKKVLRSVLSPHGISNSAIDRISRETPLADLVDVWLRPYIPVEHHQLLPACVDAVRERNEMIHHERRTVTQPRAGAMVEAIARVVDILNRQVAKDSA